MALLNVSRTPDYSDLDLDFMINPITGDINKKKGVDAIKRSIRNLIFTNYYERPFKSTIGSDVRSLLFDNVDLMTATFIEDAIIKLINNFEPRVRLSQVKVVADIDNHGFNVTIEYIEVNTETPATFNLFLERIR
jgi:phage baseplate assembly protein W